MAIDYSGLGKKKILIVEDVELNQLIARHMMESWGCEVALAVNGRQALEMVEENNYDCILMDIQMPEMDGISATQHIRAMKDPAKAGVPIIALSANVLKNDCERYREAGMNDCVPKPIVEERLFGIIAHATGHGYAQHEAVAPATASGPKAPAEKLYDLSVIQAVSGGDTEFVKKMVLLFIETVPANIRELKGYTAAHNWEMVSRMAHKLKSTLDSMGIQTLRQVTRTVEAAAKARQLTADIPALVDQIDRVVNACVAQLENDVLEQVS